MDTIYYFPFTLMPFFFIAAIAVAAFLCYRGAAGGMCPCMPRRSRRETPLDILDERFASGEIGAEEFAERRRTLIGETPEDAGAAAAPAQTTGKEERR